VCVVYVCAYTVKSDGAVNEWRFTLLSGVSWQTLDLLSRQTVKTVIEMHAGGEGQISGPTVKTDSTSNYQDTCWRRNLTALGAQVAPFLHAGVILTAVVLIIVTPCKSRVPSTINLIMKWCSLQLS
jgi:hypothetical protein